MSPAETPGCSPLQELVGVNQLFLFVLLSFCIHIIQLLGGIQMTHFATDSFREDEWCCDVAEEGAWTVARCVA